MENINDILQRLEPISLKEMDNVKLLNRADTKFLFNADLFPGILEDIQSKYYVLSTEGRRINNYKTLYFDTPDYSSYINHHNGKLNRIKIRFREYLDSNLVFFEIKLKNNKGKTIKSRFKNPIIERLLSENTKRFIKDNSFYNPEDITPVLWNRFTRITLVHKTAKERLTFDLNINFSDFNQEKNKGLSHLIIAEVKQEKMCVDSDFIQVMKKRHIRQTSISKYCVGTILINESLKSNKFKELTLKIKKIKNDRSLIA